MPGMNKLLSTPTWEILATIDKLRKEYDVVSLAYDDEQLERVLKAAIHVMHSMVRDYVRGGYITEEEYDHQLEMAEYYNVKDYKDVEVGSETSLL